MLGALQALLSESSAQGEDCGLAAQTEAIAKVLGGLSRRCRDPPPLSLSGGIPSPPSSPLPMGIVPSLSFGHYGIHALRE